MSPQFRKIFADTAYKAIMPHISLELESTTYDEIVNSIKDDNKSYIAIFSSGGVMRTELTGHLMTINILILL